jgi:hypothetical protein
MQNLAAPEQDITEDFKVIASLLVQSWSDLHPPVRISQFDHCPRSRSVILDAGLKLAASDGIQMVGNIPDGHHQPDNMWRATREKGCGVIAPPNAARRNLPRSVIRHQRHGAASQFHLAILGVPNPNNRERAAPERWPKRSAPSPSCHSRTP